MRLARAVDLWMGELARGGRTASTRASYARYLDKLVTQLERTRADVSVQEVTTNDCRRASSTAGSTALRPRSARSTVRSAGCSSGSTSKGRSTSTQWFESLDRVGRVPMTSTW
jgi:hypothetical protein